MQHVTASEASAHGLAPIGFTVDVTGSGMRATPFAGPRNYLVLNGPPGQSLLISIDANGGVLDRTSLEAAYRPSQPGAPELHVGSLMLGGSLRDAVLRVTDRGPIRLAQCTALVHAPQQRALLVTMLVGIGPVYQPPDCAALLENPSIAAFARSFRLD